MWAGGSQPQQHGGQRDHRKGGHGALLKASGDAPELLQASPEPLPQDSAQYDPVIPSGATGARTLRWKQWSELLPLHVG